jgi:hypothetical protein
MIGKLTGALSGIGKKTEWYESPDGSKVLLLSPGGRILGLFAPGSDENFIWANPELEDAKTAAAVYAGDGWHNSGGDRTWLAPELDIFFPDYPDVSRHWEPPQIDSDDFEIVQKGGGLALVKRLTLALARPKQEVVLRLTKTVYSAANPLRGEQGVALHGVQYAGYTLHTAFEILHSTGDGGFPLGIWNLIQLPHGGDMLVATHFKTQPRVFFGSIPPENLIVTDHLVKFGCNFEGENKIAVRAAALTGRAGYLWQSGHAWSLVIRNFSVNPSGDYVDCPARDEEDLGYGFEAVSVDSALGKFCELEYHAPAISYPKNRQSHDFSQIWGFRGPLEAVRGVAHALLTPEF